MTARLILGADHGGYRLKVILKNYLTDAGYEVVDCGAATFDPDDDYPVYARTVAKHISLDPTSRGILICRSGQGVAIVANKFRRVRAALAWNELAVKAARADDDANILCLPADHLAPDLASSMVETFLKTACKTESRYQRRLHQIQVIEEEMMR